jgi:hypothetical protein
MKKIFLTTSYIFCDEATEELYRIMFEVLKIAIRGLTVEEENGRVRDLSEWVRTGNEYKFFRFEFSAFFKVNVLDARIASYYEKLFKKLLLILKQKLE